MVFGPQSSVFNKTAVKLLKLAVEEDGPTPVS